MVSDAKTRPHTPVTSDPRQTKDNAEFPECSCWGGVSPAGWMSFGVEGGRVGERAGDADVAGPLGMGASPHLRPRNKRRYGQRPSPPKRRHYSKRRTCSIYLRIGHADR